MRLYDRLLSSDQTPQWLRSALPDCTVVVADNVAEYYWSGTEQEYWDVALHFPNLAPPAALMWIEAAAPALIRSTEHPPLPWSPQAPRRWAVLREAVDMQEQPLTPEMLAAGSERLGRQLEDQLNFMRPLLEKSYRLSGGDPHKAMQGLSEEERRQMKMLATMVQAQQEMATSPEKVSQTLAQGRPSDARWLVRDWLFIDDASGILPHPLWSFIYYVDGQGAFTRINAESWYTSGPIRSPRVEQLNRSYTAQEWDETAARLVPLWHTTLLTTCFMHCKNVRRTQVDPVAHWKARNPKKKGYAPVLVKYWVLDIEPMKEVLRDQGQSESHGVPRAMHFCRGHFAHYSEDAPLFGKYSGTFWRPMHVRGNAEHGEVVKDYRVLAPPGGGGQPRTQEATDAADGA